MVKQEGETLGKPMLEIGPDFPRTFTDLLDEYSIYHQRTGAKSSQQNPVAESWLNVTQRRINNNNNNI